MMMEQLILNFCSSVVPDRVIELPSKIFLCGGNVNARKTQTKYQSVRNYLYHYIKENDKSLYQKVVLAEEVHDWIDNNSGNTYTNLLDLEEDLAGLVATIPLIIESPGAIAELGAFLFLEGVPEKMIIFKCANYEGDGSFIERGCLNKFRELKDGNDEKIYTYPWSVKGKSNLALTADLNSIVPDIYSRIKRHTEDFNNTEQFSEPPWGKPHGIKSGVARVQAALAPYLLYPASLCNFE